MFRRREEILPHRTRSTRHENEGETRQQVSTRSQDQFREQEPDVTPRRIQFHRTHYEDLESTPRATSRARSPEQELPPRRRIEEGLRYVIPQRESSPTRPIGEPLRHTLKRDPSPERHVHFLRGNQPPRRRVNERDDGHRGSNPFQEHGNDAFSDPYGNADFDSSTSRGYDRPSERERRVPGAYPQTSPRKTDNAREDPSNRYRAADPLRRPRGQEYNPQSPTFGSVEDEDE